LPRATAGAGPYIAARWLLIEGAGDRFAVLRRLVALVELTDAESAIGRLAPVLAILLRPGAG